MRVERGQHAVDRGLDQLALVDLLDILRADPLEDVAEQVELLVDAAVALLRKQRPGHLRRRHETQKRAARRRHHQLAHLLVSPSARRRGPGYPARRRTNSRDRPAAPPRAPPDTGFRRRLAPPPVASPLNIASTSGDSSAHQTQGRAFRHDLPRLAERLGETREHEQDVGRRLEDQHVAVVEQRAAEPDRRGDRRGDQRTGRRSRRRPGRSPPPLTVPANGQAPGVPLRARASGIAAPSCRSMVWPRPPANASSVSTRREAARCGPDPRRTAAAGPRAARRPRPVPRAPPAPRSGPPTASPRPRSAPPSTRPVRSAHRARRQPRAPAR